MRMISPYPLLLLAILALTPSAAPRLHAQGDKTAAKPTILFLSNGDIGLSLRQGGATVIPPNLSPEERQQLIAEAQNRGEQDKTTLEEFYVKFKDRWDGISLQFHGNNSGDVMVLNDSIAHQWITSTKGPDATAQPHNQATTFILLDKNKLVELLNDLHLQAAKVANPMVGTHGQPVPPFTKFDACMKALKERIAAWGKPLDAYALIVSSIPEDKIVITGQQAVRFNQPNADEIKQWASEIVKELDKP